MVRTVAVDPGRFPVAWGHALLLLLISYPPLVLVATGAAAVLAAPDLGLATVALLVGGEVLAGRASATTELAFVARSRPVAAALVRLAAVASRTVAAVVVFVLIGSTDPQLWATATFAQSAAIATVLLWLAGRGQGRPRLRCDRTALGFGLLLMVNQVCRSLNANLDRIVLGVLLAPATLGLYVAGSRLQLVGAILTQSATRILYPRFFRAERAGPADLAALVRSATVVMAAVGLLASLATAAIAPLLPIVLGPAFAGVAGLAAALGLACPFVAVQYPPADALTASGRQSLRTAIYLGGALATTLLLGLGVLLAGLWGAVAAFIAGQAALAAALWIALRRTAPR